MKKLIVLLFFLFYCDNSTNSGDLITFNVIAGNKHIEEETVKIKDNLYVIDIGLLPLLITSRIDNKLIAEFEVHATNFPGNHPQCDCESIEYGYYRCTEEFFVTGEIWEVAK